MNKYLVEAIKEYQTWGTLFEEIGTIVSAVASSRICNPDNPFVE